MLNYHVMEIGPFACEVATKKEVTEHLELEAENGWAFITPQSHQSKYLLLVFGLERVVNYFDRFFRIFMSWKIKRLVAHSLYCTTN